MHPLLFIPLIAFLGACVVGAAIIARDPASRSRRLATGIVACGGAASGLEIVWCSVGSPAVALQLMRVAGLLTLVVGPLCLELVCVRWPQFENRLRIPRIVAAGTAAGLGLLILETTRFVSQPVATEWGFAMQGGNLMWLTCLHTLACIFVVTACLWEPGQPKPPSEREEGGEEAHRRFAIAMGALVAGAFMLDLALSLQSVPAPRLAGPTLVLAAACFWRPANAGDDALHPGAFDSVILDALSDGVAVLTDDGRVRAVNTSFEALAQQTRQRLMDQTLKDLLTDPPENPALPSQSDTHLKIEGAEAIPVSISTSPLRDLEGSVIGSAVAIRDRREIVDLQRHLVTSARFAAVGELAAGLAHEVNNPLAFIQANLNQMQRDYAEFQRRLESENTGEEGVLREGAGLIDECLVGIARVASIVREVRGFAHGGDDLERLCDVNALLEAAMRMACPPQRNSTRFERCYAELPAVYCGEQDLKQLFLGLVMHAAQPARKASRIRLVTESLGNAVRVQIEDDGRGYSEHELDCVFEPSLDETGAGSGTNEGMGLSIAYHIARQLGGEVEVDSDPAAAITCVGVVLPCGSEPDPHEVGSELDSVSAGRMH